MGGSSHGGALPPPGMEWQTGKTAASISFVNKAEAALAAGVLSQGDADKLRAEVEAVKNGARVLTDWLSVEEFLSRDP